MGSEIGWNFGTESRRIFWSKSGPCIISFLYRSESAWIWDAFGDVRGDIFGSKTDLFGNMFEGTQKTLDFRKLARRAGERLVLEVRGGILGALGDLKTI
jgi:hypothetical protein